ncbi:MULTISPECIES: sigma-70 family RNA polymerase sigma factor [unclassified Pseudomonas]|uniref:sigma-70 family RNA polymerase sigma factor n=1 Tax=unclassified Pseudomonas TaxID=196821 RepID=UPI002449082A|nr:MULTISPECIES: sigma-70 family RNA polymerase sigma factor [unclassified Pseudomonas]MDG9930337.1 sigma-70 family RNA polymerase sigma factor [Pseudomonas sp. GD04042]MDH0484550.1 sigma-70 family RNA polymerase sigma factor [Pseudomonas sp. GD04015]MDH0605992.1 sigma-70 family RNA polymerase sigma factor [Pseudomonas sp. GD03869]
MEKYYRQLVHYLTVRLRDQHLAADVAHDAYVRVLEGGRGIAAEYPQAYLYRTALNIVVDVHRRSVVRQSESLDDIEPQAQAANQFLSPQDSLYLRQRAELVERALGELPSNCREAFLLRKLDGMAHHEIASRMGISKDMVEKHIVNAMKHCRIRVKEMEYSKADPDDAARRVSRLRYR